MADEEELSNSQSLSGDTSVVAMAETMQARPLTLRDAVTVADEALFFPRLVPRPTTTTAPQQEEPTLVVRLATVIT